MKGCKVDKRSEEKVQATFVAPDHDRSVSVPFSPRIAKIVTLGITIAEN